MTYQELLDYIIKDFQNDFIYKENRQDFDSFKNYLEWVYENQQDFRNDVEYIVNKLYNEIEKEQKAWWLENGEIWNDKHGTLSTRKLYKDIRNANI